MPFRRRRDGGGNGGGDGEARENLAFAASIWQRLAAGDETVWDDLDALDRFAGGGSAEQRTAFGVDVLETLQNLLSHPAAASTPRPYAAASAPHSASCGTSWTRTGRRWPTGSTRTAAGRRRR
jgi:hypothetical protein